MFDAETGVSQAIVDSLDRRPGARLARKGTLRCDNGIDVRRFSEALSPVAPQRAALRARFGLTPDDFVIGSVGRLSEQKGYTYLLAAAPAVLAQRPEVKFVLIGDGELRDELERQTAALGLTGAFIFAGARQNTIDFYRIMDLFVLPSLWEGLPTVILESMACKIPVVATDIPGTRELIEQGRTGWLCQPQDPSSLAGVLLAALASPADRATFARAAQEIALTRYSWEVIADRFEALYDKLCGSETG